MTVATQIRPPQEGPKAILHTPRSHFPTSGLRKLGIKIQCSFIHNASSGRFSTFTMAATYGTLTFLERESWPSHERPYELLYKPSDGNFPVCNYNVVQVPDVPIHDLRPLKNTLSLDREGFLVSDLNTTMQYDDYFDQEKLKMKYMPEIKAYLKKALGVRSAYVHECVVSSPGPRYK